MTTFYAYIAPTELSSGHDPVRVLRTALSRADLVQNPSYDPDRVSFWAKADVGEAETPPVEIENQQTGADEPACICTMQTQS